MLECIYCGNENPEKNNFCRSCKRQIRCLTCKEPLELDSDMCFSCGEVVKERPIAATHNTYEFDEAHNAKTGTSSRKIRISFSDNALESVAPALSGILGLPSQSSTPTVSQRKIFQPTPAPPSRTIEALPNSTSLPAEAIQPPTPVLKPSNVSDLYAFQLDDNNQLFTTIDDFKGKTQSEQQRRFILLYILDYQSVFGSAPSDEDITEAAERLGFFEKANFKKYLKQVKTDYFVLTGDVLRPRDNLQNYLEQISEQLQDNLLKGVSMSGARKQTRKRSPSASITDSDVEYIKFIMDKYPQISHINSKDFTQPELSALALYLLKKYEGRDGLKLKVLHEIISSTRGYSTEYKRYSDNIKRSHTKLLHLKTDGNVAIMPEGEELAMSKLASLGVSV